jgi:SulP family sulfate permease
LVGIILATLIASTAGLDVPVIGAIPRTILLDQRLRLAEIPWSDAGALFVPAMSIAALGAIESLLCGAVAGNMTGVRMHNSVELVAQGIGNLLIPFFGGVPATAAIARTSVNVKSGAFTRLSSVIHGIALLAAGVAFAPIIGRVPLAALAGVLFVTAWRMNEWHAIHFFFSSRLKHAMIAFGITLAATVLLDLTQAILVGFGISSLIFMAQMSELDITRQLVDPERLAAGGHEFVHPDHPISVYYVSGPLFFAAAYRLLEKITAEDTPGTTLILSIRGVPLVDATGVHVLKEILSRQVQGGGNLLLASVQPRVEQLLKRTGVWDQVTPERIFWSADRAILSLGASLPAEPVEAAPPVNLTPTLIITPHEDRADQKF